jgi:hypothetical protein
MRAIVFDRYGEPDVMAMGEVPVPEPRDSEVLIRVAMRVSIHPTRKHAPARAHARATEYEAWIFHSSPVWTPPASWSERARMSLSSGAEIA